MNVPGRMCQGLESEKAESAEDPFRLAAAVGTICRENLGLRDSESLLIVADPPLASLVERMTAAARESGFRCALLEIGPVERAGQAPPDFTVRALARAKAVLLVTSRSLSHTEQRRAACREHGVRIASLPGLTAEMLCRLFPAGGASQVAERTLAALPWLEGAGPVRIRTERGTDLRFSLAGRKVYTDTGIYTRPGAFGNLPAGEVCAAPAAGSLEGSLVVDVAFAGLGAVDSLRLEIADGKIAEATGSRSADLLALLAPGPDRTAGEFGLGTNPLARLGPVTLEAEKAVGTVHFGFGDNRSFGGENRASGHWDAVLRCERIEVDGREVRLAASVTLDH
jgi:leucyl aminopeptidase (aminopeptidase T)